MFLSSAIEHFFPPGEEELLPQQINIIRLIQMSDFTLMKT